MGRIKILLIALIVAIVVAGAFVYKQFRVTSPDSGATGGDKYYSDTIEVIINN